MLWPGTIVLLLASVLGASAIPLPYSLCSEDLMGIKSLEINELPGRW